MTKKLKFISATICLIGTCLLFGSLTVVTLAQNSSQNGLTKEENDAIQDSKPNRRISEEKNKTKNLEQAKNKVNTIIDRTIKKLNKTKERVSGMPTISADLKTELNTKIDESIAKLNARKTAVNAATTKEELKTAMEGFKTEVKEVKRIVKDIVEAIHKTHLQTVIKKLETFVTKVESKVNNIGDTTEKAEAVSLVADAKTKIENAKTLNDEGNIAEARKTIKAAFRDLRNALQIANEKEGSDE